MLHPPHCTLVVVNVAGGFTLASYPEPGYEARFTHALPHNVLLQSRSMVVASGPAGPVLAGPVFTVIFGTAHAQIINNE